MHTCQTLPPTRFEGRYCNDSAVPGVTYTSALSISSASGGSGSSWGLNASCINWNQYYTNCKAGEKNPFQGAISFDNIGLAWVAIFLVSNYTVINKIK